MVEDERTRRAAEMAETTALSSAEIRRRVLAEMPGSFSYARCTAIVRRARNRGSSDPARRDPAGLAARILHLLDVELSRLEGQSRASMDLDRLDRIARTLRTVEPIRPQSQKARGASLRSVVPEEEQAQTLGDLSQAVDG